MSSMVHNARGAALAAALLAVFTGCGTHKHQETSAQPEQSIVWPAPPDPARIAFVQSVHRPAELGVKYGAFTRLGHWLTGSERGNEALVKPFGVTIDPEDNVCVTDTGSGAVCFYERAKRKWHRWEKLGRQRLISPVAVAKGQERLYVADSTLGRVLVSDLEGKLLLQITNHLQRPVGLTLVGERLWVVDSARHCLASFDQQGHFVSEFGHRGTGPGEFNFPTHVAADSEGTLYVTDSMNYRVQMFDSGGALRGRIGSAGDSPGQLSRPKGVAVDSYGHVYVLDGNFDNLQIFDRQGRLLLNLGEAGEGPGQFWLPAGIAIDRQNQIYVADSYNRRLQIFKYIGPS